MAKRVSSSSSSGIGFFGLLAVYLEPVADPDREEGRLWCEDDDPGGTGYPWVKYVRADLHAEVEALNERLRETVNRARMECQELKSNDTERPISVAQLRGRQEAADRILAKLTRGWV